MNDRQLTSSFEAPGAARAGHQTCYRALEWVDRHFVDWSSGAQTWPRRALCAPAWRSFSAALADIRTVSDQERMSRSTFLQTCQKIDTGLFVDLGSPHPRSRRRDGSGDDDNPLNRLVTCFALQTLKLLGRPAAGALHFMDALGIHAPSRRG